MDTAHLEGTVQTDIITT